VDEPFVTQIVPYAFPYAPKGWAFCNGSLLNVAQNQAVFSLLGTLYNTNGDGLTTFNLPDLRGRTPIHRGAYNGVTTQQGVAAQGGTESFTIPPAVLPSHTHQIYAQTTSPTQTSPAGNMYATLPTTGNPTMTGRYTTTPTSTAAMDPTAFATTGASAPMSNLQPSIALNFCIAMTGIYPQRQ
jgi:microcystin-dependent protein